MIQGLAFGAEWGGAVMMTFEHAPWKKRGRFAAIPQAGNPLGITLANAAFLLSASLQTDWAWRLPFLASSVLIVVGLVVRMKLEESPEFEHTKAMGAIVKNPLATVIKNDWRNILRVISLRIVESCAYYVTATYLLSYITKNNPDDRAIGLTGIVIASLLAIPVTLIAGALTDRIGRRKLYLGGTIAVIVFGFPMFLLSNTGNPFLIVLAFVIGIGIIHATFTGTQGAWFAELFRTNTRTSGASIGYQVAASISGFAPFLAVLLASIFGWAGGASLYVLVGVIGLIGVLNTRETWGAKEKAEVDAIIAGEPAAAAEDQPAPSAAR